MVPDRDDFRMLHRLKLSSFDLDGSMGMAFGGSSGGAVANLRQDWIRDKTLDPRIQYSRGTDAMMHDSTGKLTFGPANYMRSSESFVNTSFWTASELTVSSNAATPPTGMQNVDKLIPSTNAAAHLINQAWSAKVLSYMGSVRVKAAGYSAVAIGLMNNGANNGAAFNLNTGAKITSVSNSPFSGEGQGVGIISEGDGWYRIFIKNIPNGAGNWYLYLYVLPDGSNYNSAGNGTDGILVTAAHVEPVTYETTPRPYTAVQARNQFGPSERFDQAQWTKNATTVAATAYASPNNKTRARKMVEAATTAVHTISFAGGNVGRLETIQVQAAPAERNWIYLTMGNHTAFFNVAAGTVGTVTAGATAECIAQGSGFYLCSMTVTRAGSNANAIGVTTGDGVTSYAGNASNGIYIYAAQLNIGNRTTYVPNYGTAPTGVYYGPRFSYDTAGTFKGFLIEKQSQNTLLWSNLFSTGTWVKVNGAVTTNALTNVDGTASVFTFTASNANAFLYQTSVLANGVTGTASIWIRRRTGTGNVTLRTTPGSTDTVIPVTSSWTRVSVQITGNGTQDCFVLGLATNGDAVDVYGAQLETGTEMTSTIITGAAAVTRNADFTGIFGADFLEIWNPNAGTFYINGSNFGASGAGSGYIIANDNTNQNRITLLSNGSGRATGAFMATGNVTQADLTLLGSVAANVNQKMTVAFAPNDVAGVATGGTVQPDSTATLPTVTQLLIGDFYSVQEGKGQVHILELAYFPNRLANSVLQQMVA